MTATRKGPPFTLPKEPIDRYDVYWYEVDTRLHTISECRAVYHVLTRWQELYPDDTPPGEPFVNEWQIFRKGHFTGRSREGWSEGWVRLDWSNDYATPKLARMALRKALLYDIERATMELGSLHKKLEDLNDEAWEEWEKAHPEETGLGEVRDRGRR